MSTLSTFPGSVSSSNILPTTLRGIKKRAKKICLPGQTHSDALDMVAREVGYRDYRQLQQAWESREALKESPPQARYPVFLSAYWRDSNSTPRSAGCETLKVYLGRPLSDIVSKHQTSYARNLEGFRQEAPDHLEKNSNADGQARAWEVLVRAALSLQFMEASGLRPATSEKQRQPFELLEGFPAKDHVSRWIDPTSGTWIALDEPYAHVNEEDVMNQRAAWASNSGLHLAKPDWAGLYYPGHAVPHLISPSQDLLRKTAEALGKLSPIAAVPSDQTPWEGMSEPYNVQFMSPERTASGVARRARPGTTYGFSKGAVQYRREAGYPSLWRPESPLSKQDHKLVGAQLQCLMISPMPVKAYEKIRSWCSTLEDWMYSEYRNADRGEGFDDTYYGGKPSTYSTDAEQLAALERIRAILTKGYVECKPRRDLLKDLEIAKAIIVRQAT
jgi:hypothetical protein